MSGASKIRSVWCYSIYGDDTRKYYEPMVENIKLAKENGIGVVLHTNKRSEAKVREFFSKFRDDITLLVHEKDHAEAFPKILRFMTSNWVAAEFYFFKDSDSVVTSKEISIMNDWMCSADPVALILRDHPLHISPILAGMFGVNRQVAELLASSALQCFSKATPAYRNPVTYDQDWLTRKIYTKIARSASVSTSFFHFSQEKVTRIGRDVEGYRYIGAQIYKRSANEPEHLEGYLRLYGDDLLSIPYFPRLSLLYGRVRPTLAVAYAIHKTKKILHRFA